MGDSDYSFSLTTFSPSGKLVQIEYALNAVAAGSTSLGIKGEQTAVPQIMYFCLFFCVSSHA
jgi:20S proteasome subunit alpha 2